MNVSQIYGNRQNMRTLAMTVKQSNNIKVGLDNGKRDTVEISATAYERNVTGEKMTATSGKDTLGITKGDTDNSFVIHFLIRQWLAGLFPEALSQLMVQNCNYQKKLSSNY